MTAAALERLKLTSAAWRGWFAHQVSIHGVEGISYRIMSNHVDIRDWASGETQPTYAARIGIFALLDDTDGPPSKLRQPQRARLPLPDNVDLTLPLKTLMARYGGSESRYQILRRTAGIKIPAGRRPNSTPIKSIQ